MADLDRFEREILIGLSRVTDPGFPFEWLRPRFKPAAKRLRDRGLLRKTSPDQLRLTAAGRAAVPRS